MNSITKFIISTVASTTTMPLLASAHPGHDGHELIWDLYKHGLWDSPLALFIGAMLSSALVFRFAFGGKGNCP